MQAGERGTRVRLSLLVAGTVLCLMLACGALLALLSPRSQAAQLSLSDVPLYGGLHSAYQFSSYGSDQFSPTGALYWQAFRYDTQGRSEDIEHFYRQYFGQNSWQELHPGPIAHSIASSSSLWLLSYRRDYWRVFPLWVHFNVAGLFSLPVPTLEIGHTSDKVSVWADRSLDGDIVVRLAIDNR